jgi:hypothetical protein
MLVGKKVPREYIDKAINCHKKAVFNLGKRNPMAFPGSPRTCTMSQRIKAVLSYFESEGYTLEQLREKNRRRVLVNWRTLYVYAMRNYTDLTTTEIGAKIDRDHATVLHMERRHEMSMIYPDWIERIEMIDKYFRSRNITKVVKRTWHNGYLYR